MHSTHPDLRLRHLLECGSNVAEATEALSILLNGGYGIWEDGEPYCVRHLVDKVGNLKIVVYPKDHMPPHFHIRSPGLNAALRIDNCELIAGELTPQQNALIQRWHKSFKTMLLTAWINTRPGEQNQDN